MRASVNRPVWVDLGSQDAAGSRAFYTQLLGWEAEPNPDPQFGGYAVARLDGKDVAGIGPAQSPDQPTAWSVYIGTPDIGALSAAVEAAGGRVVASPFPVGPMGTMAVYQDPTGAFVSAWQAGVMTGFTAEGIGAFAWAELTARGLERGVAFYQQVFGWGRLDGAVPAGPYVELLDEDRPVAGAMEMPPMVPAEVPSYWQIYFLVADIDAAEARARELGAEMIMPATPTTGGRFAILRDPQGAVVGLFER